MGGWCREWLQTANGSLEGGERKSACERTDCQACPSWSVRTCLELQLAARQSPRPRATRDAGGSRWPAPSTSIVLRSTAVVRPPSDDGPESGLKNGSAWSRPNNVWASSSKPRKHDKRGGARVLRVCVRMISCRSPARTQPIGMRNVASAGRLTLASP